jgi:hypothetical protein
MASQGIPDRDEFEKAWKLLMELNKEIDGNTEEYLWWYGARPDRRGRDRAVTERKKGDWEAGLSSYTYLRSKQEEGR